MELPIVFPDIRGQNFECRGCTRCCRELVVHLTAEDRQKIDRQNWLGRIEGMPYMQLGDAYVLRHDSAGACVFLQADGRCRIHAEYGATEKPLACRMFPFTLERAGDGVYASIRLDCPTAARSDGRPIATYRTEIKRLTESAVAQEVIPSLVKDTRVEVGDKARISARHVDELSEKLDRWLTDESIPFGRRMAGLCEFVRTLDAAKLARMSLEAAGDLCDLLITGIGELADEHLSKKMPPPTSKQAALLRQAVFAHSEQVTFEQIVATLWPAIRFRFNQLLRARRMTRGRGETPRIRGIEGTPTFAELEAIEGSPGEFERLVCRYLSSRIQGRAVFGGGYYGWNLVDGLSALLISVACIGWLSRLSAAARGSARLTHEDVETAVGIVDRAGGRAPELGAHSARLRVRYLSNDDGISRLIRRYAVDWSAA